MKLTIPSLALLTAGTAPAFPPVPYYTLYGMVRDQAGQTVNVEGAWVLLLKDGKELSRTPVKSFLRTDQNYEMNVRLDQIRQGTTFYSASAIAPGAVFSLTVEMGGQRYLPIEVSGNLTAGKGAERVKLDLTLGEDKDRDGLPDAWETWQLYQAGNLPGANGWDLSLLNKDGDFDGDGQSNFKEYLAGTFAGDVTEFFKLEIKGKAGDRLHVEFFGITNKVYTIESSPDNVTWTRIPMAAAAATAVPANSWQATGVGVVQAFVTATPGARSEFFRLTVR
ncbi:MAG: hypothetical protein V4726_04370 [Verrucomicrobiota bacterium]